MKRYSLKPKPPLLIFITIVLVTVIVSSVLINYVIGIKTSPSRPDFFRFSNNYFEFDFPKNWYARSGENRNEALGNSYAAVLRADPLRVIIIYTFYDEKATQTFLTMGNITDAFGLNDFSIKRDFNWTRQENSNSTLYFIQNGTTTISGFTADYSTFGIRNGLQQNDLFYNTTGTYISLIKPNTNGKTITQIVVYGEENDWKQSLDKVEIVLNSTELTR